MTRPRSTTPCGPIVCRSPFCYFGTMFAVFVCMVVCCCQITSAAVLTGKGEANNNGVGTWGRHLRAADSPPTPRMMQKAKCSGGFDIYFVLDKSGSVTEEQFQLQTVNFVEALLNRFTSSKIRASFITFSGEAEVITALTGDRSLLKSGIQRLRNTVTEGGTYIHFGIEQAKDQIMITGGDTASVIVTLTDGILDDTPKAIRQANDARALGASVLAVRVGDSDSTDLLHVADKPTDEHIFRGDTFNDLNHIIDKIVNTSCVEILSASPTEVCTGESFNVTISGNGFTRTNDVSKVLCNFRLNDTDNQEVKPHVVTDSELICPGPHIEEAGNFVVLQVSVNGISYISSNVTITAKNCEPPNVTGIVLGVLFFLLALLLFLLWWFWQIICCVVVVKDPPPKPAPPTPNSKKWPAVDASYYGGGGVGGIKAMRVDWGADGCTEGGSHLEKAKGANTVAVIDESDDLKTRQPGCLEIYKRKMASCFAPIKTTYNRISVMRPAPGEKGPCCKVQR